MQPRARDTDSSHSAARDPTRATPRLRRSQRTEQGKEKPTPLRAAPVSLGHRVLGVRAEVGAVERARNVERDRHRADRADDRSYPPTRPRLANPAMPSATNGNTGRNMRGPYWQAPSAWTTTTNRSCAAARASTRLRSRRRAAGKASRRSARAERSARTADQQAHVLPEQRRGSTSMTCRQEDPVTADGYPLTEQVPNETAL